MDITHWVSIMGYIGIFSIIFAETGIFVGFFLPGDSLLFTAGFLASQQLFSIRFLLPGVFLCSVSGYFLGYYFGNKLGTWLLHKPDTIWFKKKYIHDAEVFYAKHGGKALILGRLIPIIRTFVPIVAGMGRMNFRRYAIFNLVGGFLWTQGLLLAGFYLGNVVPNAEHYVLPIVLTIVFLSVLPTIKPVFDKALKRIKKTRETEAGK